MKQFTRGEIIGAYNKLPASRQVPILWDALGHMNTNSNRTKIDCIIAAMGYAILDRADVSTGEDMAYVPYNDNPVPVK